MNKRESIKQYFQPFPQWAAYTVGAGVLLAVLGGQHLFGLIAIGVGGAFVYMALQKPIPLYS